MTPPDSGPEPSGWELMRAITRLENVVTAGMNAAVQQKVYDADKKGNDDRHARSEARVRDLEAQNARESEKKQDLVEDADRMRRQMRLSISLSVSSPVIAVIVAILAKGLTQ